MKRTTSVLAATVLGATLIGINPASATTSSIDCTAGDYTRVRESFTLTNLERGAVDGFNYRITASPVTIEVCLDIPDTSTFTIEARIRSFDTQRVFVDDRPGDKIFRYSLDANSFWQTYGTLTGPDSTYLHYTWYEKQIPA